MILLATFEAKETVPPKAWHQCRKALANVLEAYGFDVTIREDRQSELDANMRFWDWAAGERAKRDAGG